MTSKEALKKIGNYPIGNFGIFTIYDKFQEDFDLIKQDLERLEVLEKENKVVRETLDIVMKSTIPYEYKIDKLKKAIEILKDFFAIGECYETFLINANGFDSITQEEYELLKEVLKDE